MLLEATDTIHTPSPECARPSAVGLSHQRELEAIGRTLQLRRRQVEAKQVLFHTGQPAHCLFLVHAGSFKTSVVSPDGREKITGFRMRGDLLGLEALGSTHYGGDATALDHCEVWELPFAQIDAGSDELPRLREQLTAALAREVRRDWHWMLSVGTLNAEQRVVAFLIDLAERQRQLGYSARRLMLRMTRADLGNFLALQLETVTRSLSRLQANGLIGVAGREVTIERPDALQWLLTPTATCH